MYKQSDSGLRGAECSMKERIENKLDVKDVMLQARIILSGWIERYVRVKVQI